MISEYENELREIASAKAKLDAREKEIKNAIKKEHDSDNSCVYGGIQVQCVSGYFTTEFDIDAFKVANRSLFNLFQKPVYKQPTIKIVLVKRNEEK